MKIKTEKLRKKMIQNNYANDTFAKTIGVNQEVFCNKLDSREDLFTIKEMYSIIGALGLTKEEVWEIFFSSCSRLRDRGEI